jgi:hypothetical protein
VPPAASGALSVSIVTMHVVDHLAHVNLSCERVPGLIKGGDQSGGHPPARASGGSTRTATRAAWPG